MLGPAEFIDMGSLSRDSSSNVAAQGCRKGSTSLVRNMDQKVAHHEGTGNPRPALV